MVSYIRYETLEMQADSSSTQGLVERRRATRLSFTEPVQFRDVLKAHELFTGSIARDLSAGGLRIRSEKPLAKEKRLLVRMTLPGSRREIRAIARVAWDFGRPFGSGAEAGLQFIGISPEDRDAVAGFVERGVVVS